MTSARACGRSSPGKTRITIRIDNDIIKWFRVQIEKANGGSYQTVINDALCVHRDKGWPGGALLRVIRELATYNIKKTKEVAPLACENVSTAVTAVRLVDGKLKGTPW
jgi:hypothetical protein